MTKYRGNFEFDILDKYVNKWIYPKSSLTRKQNPTYLDMKFIAEFPDMASDGEEIFMLKWKSIERYNKNGGYDRRYNIPFTAKYTDDYIEDQIKRLKIIRDQNGDIKEIQLAFMFKEDCVSILGPKIGKTYDYDGLISFLEDFVGNCFHLPIIKGCE